MRILIVSSPHAFATRDVYAGHLNGLRANLGQENVVSYDILPRMNLLHRWTKWLEEDSGFGHVPRELAANVLAAEPVFGAAHWHEVDVVYFISPMYFPMSIVDLLRKDGFKVWAYFTECPYEDEMWARCQATHFDACFVNDRNSLTRWRAFNEHTAYIPHAYDPTRHHPGRGPAPGHEHVVFVGSCFPLRRAFLEAANWDGVDLRLYGNYEGTPDDSPLQPYIRNRLIDNEFTARIYRGASIGLSFHRIERWWGQPDLIDPGEAYSVGPRTYELAACGCFQVSDYRPALREIFDETVPIFQTPEEMEREVRFYLRDPMRRAELATRQHELVKPHTVEARMRQLLEIAS